METKIIRTLKEWVPSIFNDHDEYTDYEALQSLAQYCIEKTHNSVDEQLKVIEAIKVVNLLYVNGTLHDRNAIENEFLSLLAAEDAPATLKKHMEMLPTEMKQAYLKTIIEN